jgi:hypothetical protein
MSNSNPEHFARQGYTDGSNRSIVANAETVTTVRSIAADIADQPTASLVLVLGFVAGSDTARATPGRIAALCDELIRRKVYYEILSALDPDLARRINILYAADRGQRWAATGRR